ncbi:MAG: signal peptidase I [Candidatus Aenigmarchaeota archaeon]|nr:signal peptidase I [Candidatus Aenigmarchaeota archaeon]
MKKKELIENIKYIIFGILAAYLLNLLIGLILGTSLPVVAVVSESMTHDALTPLNHYKFLQENYNFTEDQINSWPINNGFRKGDVLVIKGIEESELNVGDVIVYNIKGQKIPIVHRIVKISDKIVTKGDHNPVADGWTPYKIHGKTIFVVPYLGWPKLLLTELLARLF